MKYNKKIFVSIFWVVLGVILTVMNFKHQLDSYWSGLGTAFIVVGALQIMRYVKYAKNEEYREKVDTRNNDERNRFIGARAWAWAGYLYVIIGAVATIVLHLIDMKDIAYIISMCICAILIFYWISYTILNRKY